MQFVGVNASTIHKSLAGITTDSIWLRAKSLEDLELRLRRHGFVSSLQISKIWDPAPEAVAVIFAMLQKTADAGVDIISSSIPCYSPYISISSMVYPISQKLF